MLAKRPLTIKHKIQHNTSPKMSRHRPTLQWNCPLSPWIGQTCPHPNSPCHIFLCLHARQPPLGEVFRNLFPNTYPSLPYTSRIPISNTTTNKPGLYYLSMAKFIYVSRYHSIGSWPGLVGHCMKRLISMPQWIAATQPLGHAVHTT